MICNPWFTLHKRVTFDKMQYNPGYKFDLILQYDYLSYLADTFPWEEGRVIKQVKSFHFEN